MCAMDESFNSSPSGSSNFASKVTDDLCLTNLAISRKPQLIRSRWLLSNI